MTKLRWQTVPVVVLSSACMPQTQAAYPVPPLGPATALGMSHQATVAQVSIEVSSADVASWWQLPENVPWQWFEKLTLVSALDGWRDRALPEVRDLAVVERAARAGANAGRVCTLAGTLWVVDLRGAASVAFGQAMSQASAQPIAVVLTFNNWPAESEVIPAEETLAALATMSPAPLAADADDGVPVFLLDSWRLAYRDRSLDPRLTDNRYMLGPRDFPDAELLAESDIERVVYVVDSAAETKNEEDDLLETFLAYRAAGISTTMVDLDELAGATTNDECEAKIAAKPLTLEYRVTVVDDPVFHARAHGFAGFHPFPIGRPGGG